jgi:co-chaperonin GroES (HSP10)
MSTRQLKNYRDMLKDKVQEHAPDIAQAGVAGSFGAGVAFQYAGGLDEAFPDISDVLDFETFGNRVLLQVRVAAMKTAGGIELPSETRDTESANMQVAKVLQIGPLAFKNRNTGEMWPEGAWARVGEFVRIPKSGGDHWEIRRRGKPTVEVRLFDDLQLLGRITKDPLAQIYNAYV